MSLILFVFLFAVFSSLIATLYKKFNSILLGCNSVICLIICLCPKNVSECCFDVVSLSVYVWCICLATFVILSETLIFFILLKLYKPLLLNCYCLFFINIGEGMETKLEGLSVFLGNVRDCFFCCLFIICKFFVVLYLPFGLKAMCSKRSLNVNIYSYLNCCEFFSQDTQVFLNLRAVIITLPP